MLQYINNELYYYGINLLDLVKKFGSPLKIRYLPAIKENILSLKECFQCSMKKWRYPKDYIYANANKANYYADVLSETIAFADAIEVSSYFDLLLTEQVIEKKDIKSKCIICNGIKTNDYLTEIIRAHNRGLNIIPIIDDLQEYRFFEKANLSGKLSCGIRMNIKNAYKKEDSHADNDRFGFNDTELQEFIKVFDGNRFILVMLHYHQRADLFDEQKALLNMQYVFEQYFVPLKSKFPSLQIFNLGGGVPYAENEEINYQQYADNIVETLVKLCRKHKVEYPNIMQENGRYTVANSTAYIYRVIHEKTIEGITWYIVDSSFISTLPNTWALKSTFRFMPINLANNNTQKVCLAGSTCDSDDVYYYQTKSGRITMPVIHQDEILYIAAFGVGAYQEIVSGAEGVYHCLLPSAAEVVIFDDAHERNCVLRRDRQSVEDVLEKLHF